jgi:hypothetical protein
LSFTMNQGTSMTGGALTGISAAKAAPAHDVAASTAIAATDPFSTERFLIDIEVPRLRRELPHLGTTVSANIKYREAQFLTLC